LLCLGVFVERIHAIANQPTHAKVSLPDVRPVCGRALTSAVPGVGILSPEKAECAPTLAIAVPSVV
jgi:hypothetical protein